MSRDHFGTYMTPDDYEIAKKNGIKDGTIRTRICRGWSVSKTINTPPRYQRRYDDEYQFFKKLAVMNGISARTYKARVLNGMDYEKAASSPIVLPNRETMLKAVVASAKKRKYISDDLKKLALSNGISYGTLRARIHGGRLRGLEVATVPPMTKQNHPWKKDNKLAFMTNQEKN